jgi:hypothetical protein
MDWQCTICQKTFATKQALRGHCSKKHGGTGMPEDREGFKCEICGETYGSKSGLYGHMKRHRNEPPPPPPKPETIRDVLLELLNEPEIPVEIRLKYALRILSMTE